jgi:hypothetical protein
MLCALFALGTASFVGGYRKVDLTDETVVFVQNTLLGTAQLFPEADGVAKIIEAETQIVAGFNVAAKVLIGSLEVKIVIWVDVQQKKRITSIEEVNEGDWIWKDIDNVDPRLLRLAMQLLKRDHDLVLRIEKVMVYRVKGKKFHLVFEGSDGKLHGMVISGKRSLFYQSLNE